MLAGLPAIAERASARGIVERANVRHVDPVELIAPKRRESEVQDPQGVRARTAREGAVRVERIGLPRSERRLIATIEPPARREDKEGPAEAAYAAQTIAQEREGMRLHLENWRGAIGAYLRAALLAERPTPSPNSLSLLV